MTNKKFKLAAMSLATAVAVSAVGPSASAVTYYLGDGSVTVDKDDTRGAYSYQGEDGSEEHRTYVNEDEADYGTIYVKGGNAPTGDVTPPTDNSGNGTEETTTGNTITVKEDVKEGTTSTDHTTDSSADNTENNTPTETAPGNTITVKEDVTGATIVVDGVNVDITSTPAEVPADAKEDKTIIKVGEGADVDLTVKDSNLTTGGNGIDIGVNLEGKDENKETNVDLTLDNTKINLTQNGKVGINVQDNSNVDLTLKGENVIDGSEAIKNEKENILTKNVNVEGIRVGDGGASDGSGTSAGAETNLTISGGVEKTETEDADTEETESPAGGSLTINKTTGGLVMADAFGPDSNVKVTGENIDGTDSAQYTVTIYGALREVTDPVIPTNPKPETPEGSDPTPPAPTAPTTPAVQDARPTTPAVEQAVAKTTPAPETPVNPPVQDARPESGKLIQTGTTNWMADVLVRAGGVLLAAGYLLERKRKGMFHKAQH